MKSKKFAVWMVSLRHTGYIMRGGGVSPWANDDRVMFFDSVNAANDWIEWYKNTLNLVNTTSVVPGKTAPMLLRLPKQ